MESLPTQAKDIVKSLMAKVDNLTKVNEQQALELKYRGTVEAAKIESADKRAADAEKTKRFQIEAHGTTARRNSSLCRRPFRLFFETDQ